MAERSKAPDSRVILFTYIEWAFWSTNVGVGSNPTSDNNFYHFLHLLSGSFIQYLFWEKFLRKIKEYCFYLQRIVLQMIQNL